MVSDDLRTSGEDKKPPALFRLKRESLRRSSDTARGVPRSSAVSPVKSAIIHFLFFLFYYYITLLKFCKYRGEILHQNICMKKNLLPFAAFMFLCAVFFVAAGALLRFSPSRLRPSRRPRLSSLSALQLKKTGIPQKSRSLFRGMPVCFSAYSTP